MSWRFCLLGISLLACSAAPRERVPPASAPPAPLPTFSEAAEPPPPPPLPPVVEDPPHVRPPLPKVASCTRSAVVLVIDRSGSMTGVPIESAKTGAEAALAKLDQRDCFGLILFDSKPTRFIPLAPLKDKASVKARIAQITPDGGTEIRSALDEGGREVLAAENAPRRAVLLMTDGQSPTTGIRDLTASLAREKVTVSTIGLGGGVDESLLRMIANEGNGRASFVRNPLDLPTIMAGEVARILTP